MGKVLETICDLYAACESKEAEVAIQLKKKDDEPWYQSNTFKWVVGAVVVVGAGVAAAAVLTVGAPLLLTTFVVGAAIGAATGAVAGGIIGGIAAEKNGENVADGIADGLLWGSIGGLLSGGITAVGAVIGAGAAVMALTEGAIGAEIYSANTLYNGMEVTAEGTLLSFGAATVGAVVGGAVLAPVITGIKTAVVGVAEKSMARGIGKTVSKEVTEGTASATGKAAVKSVGEGGKYSVFGEMSEADGIRYRDWHYEKINELSIHNADSDTLTLGKFRPSKNPDGTDNWKIAGQDSYNVIAEKSGDMYFDMKDGLYDDVMNNYNLSYQNMFDEFNTSALDKAISKNKTIRFSHNPELSEYAGSFTDKEWKYLQEKGDYLYLREEGGFWYAEK